MDENTDACNVTETHVMVPYDKYGKKSKTNMLMSLDLSKGQKIRLNPEHNCQKAMQPVYMHIGASTPQTYRGSVRQPGHGEGHVVRYSPKNGGWELKVDGVSMLLGGWWLETARRGQVESIPIINIDPEFVEAPVEDNASMCSMENNLLS